MTPRQVERAMRAKSKASDIKQNRLAWAVWHVAALSRAKKLPKLDAMLTGGRNRKAQTPEQMLAMVRALNAAFGGAIIEKKG